MKTGIHSLKELAAEITRRSKAKKDVVASSGAIVIAPHDKEVKAQIGTELFGINDVAHRQIQGHLKIPAEYYDRMRKDQPGLLANNINVWLHRSGEKRLVRTLDGNVRAFLSDRYRPLENEDLARAVLPVLTKMKLDVMSCAITDTRLFIKAVDPAVTRELAKVGAKWGDNMHKIVRVASPAITIQNSEVGFSALSVLVGIYDAFCSNLASFSERSARKYHIGGKHDIGDEAYAMLSDDTRRKTDAALWGQIGDVTKAAFNKAHFNELVDKIEATRSDKIEGDIIQVVSFASKKFGMTDAEGSDVLQHLIEGGDLSRFGLYNAVTRTAEDLDDYDRASDFERMGGKIIELPRKEWAEVAQAA